MIYNRGTTSFWFWLLLSKTFKWSLKYFHTDMFETVFSLVLNYFRSNMGVTFGVAVVLVQCFVYYTATDISVCFHK